MTREVAIIGVCQTRHEAHADAHSLTDTIFAAASGALADAGVTIDDVDSVVLAAHDVVDGISISNMVTGPAAGCSMKDEVRVTEDGAFALPIAYARLASGHMDLSIVVSWSKCSQVDLATVTNLTFDPFFHRFAVLNYVTCGALQAAKYVHSCGATEEHAARVVVKNRSHALNNPYAHLRQSVTLAEVLDSPNVAWPLKTMDLPPVSDGACALVLAASNNGSRERYGQIAGIGWAFDTYYVGDRDLEDLAALRTAARRAYSMAGIRDPLNDLDIAEVHDISSVHEMMEYEALGFCGRGEGGDLLDSGTTTLKGRLPVNPSGGCLSANPYCATGLIRVAEAAIQVGGRGGDRQVPGVKTALGHGAGGLAGQGHCVVIVSR